MNFRYSASNSRTERDPDHVKNALLTLFEAAELPLRLEEEGDVYFIDSKDVSNYQPLCSTYANNREGANVEAFTCDVEGVSLESAIDKMRRALEALSSPKHFWYEWEAWPSSTGIMDTPDAETVYRFVQEANFPAEKYEMRIHLYLKDLDGIEANRALCGPKDKIDSEIIAFKIPHSFEPKRKMWISFEVRTRAQGHQLLVVSRHPLNDLDDFCNKLGVELTRKK